MRSKIGSHPVAARPGVPDAYRGESIKAFIVVKPGVTLKPDELDLFCRERLAKYKIPKTYEFVDELPMTATGKIIRKQLRQKEMEKYF